MRILHVNTINQVANLYADGLAHLGHASRIYQPSLAGGNRPLPIKLARMPGRVLDLRHVVGCLHPAHCDLAHIHWASYGALGLVGRVPFVVQCHGADVRHRLKVPVWRRALAPVLRRAAAVLCTTPDLVPIVQTMRPDASFFPGPVDTEHFAPTARDGASPWTVFLFTRLDPEKGAQAAAEGIARFAVRHPQVRVQVVDWGRLSKTLRERFGQRFDFVPRVAPGEIRRLIWQADVVVGQIALDAIGLSELQAMSCAKPVIASFGYPEAYSEPPPLYLARTPESIDAHLEHVYRQPHEAAILGASACEWVRIHHDYKGLARRLEALYQSVK